MWGSMCVFPKSVYCWQCVPLSLFWFALVFASLCFFFLLLFRQFLHFICRFFSHLCTYLNARVCVCVCVRQQHQRTRLLRMNNQSVLSLIIKSSLSWWEPEEGDGARERGRGIIDSAAGVHALSLSLSLSPYRVAWLRCVMSTSLLCSPCSPT